MMRNAPSGFTLIHIASVEAVPDARAWSGPREPSKEPVMNEFTDPCLDQSRHRSWPQKSDMGLDQLVMIGTRTRALQCQSVRSTAAQADVSIPEELNATHLHGGCICKWRQHWCFRVSFLHPEVATRSGPAEPQNAVGFVDHHRLDSVSAGMRNIAMETLHAHMRPRTAHDGQPRQPNPAKGYLPWGVAR